MKKFRRALTSLTILVFMSITSSTVYAQSNTANTGSTGETASNQNESNNSASSLSEACTNILAVSKSRNPDETRQCAPGGDFEVGGGNDDIIVILGESISGGSQEFSCGQVVNCLREKYKGQKLAEGLVTCELQKDYNQCIVSGKDGLGLLSNYASQVYNWIAGIVGSICILVIIISGIQISIGGLSQEEVSSAKDRVLRALVGMVVLFLSAFILYTINPFFFT